MTWSACPQSTHTRTLAWHSHPLSLTNQTAVAGSVILKFKRAFPPPNQLWVFWTPRPVRLVRRNFKTAPLLIIFDGFVTYLWRDLTLFSPRRGRILMEREFTPLIETKQLSLSHWNDAIRVPVVVAGCMFWELFLVLALIWLREEFFCLLHSGGKSCYKAGF